MEFVETPLKGAFKISMSLLKDNRGFFARSYCAQAFEKAGICSSFVQSNVSYNQSKGTLRGMHFQAAPYEEAKLVRCSRGAIFDVIVDIRPGSETFKHWYALELRPDDGTMLYIPGGFAHGFQTLVDDTEVLYQMSEYYHPDASRGLRWDDADVGIVWPDEDNRIISEKDLGFPELKELIKPST